MAGGKPAQTRHRARLTREISHIAMRYGWGWAVDRVLDEMGVVLLKHLETHQLEALHAQLQQALDNAMAACDLPDDLPAR